PGAVLLLAEEAARHARSRSPGRILRGVPGKSRSDRQFGRWQAATPVNEPGPVSGDDRLYAVDAGLADAVPGTGIRLDEAVCLFRRPPSRAGGRCQGRPQRVPAAVP